jgi:hypothetical protein
MVFGAQTRPHAPQFLGSLWMSMVTQVPLQQA